MSTESMPRALVFLLKYLAFILMPRSINRSGERPSPVMTAHAITMTGFWVEMANQKTRFLGDLYDKYTRPLRLWFKNSLSSTKNLIWQFTIFDYEKQLFGIGFD